MAKVIETVNSDTRRAVVIARGLAHAAKAKTAGVEFLLAGLLRALGPDRSSDLLKASGVADVHAFFSALPWVDEANLDSIRPVQPSNELAEFLRGDLAAVLAGTMAPEAAAEIILASRACDTQVKRFLSNPASILKCHLPRPAPRESTRTFLQGLACFYQKRWQLGRLYYSIDAKKGMSDFAAGTREDIFFTAVDALRTEQRATCNKVFDHQLFGDSLLGRCQREFGEISAHAMGLVLLGEIGQVGDGPVTVREIAFSLSPKYFHRYLAVARDAVRQLHGADLVQAVSGGEVQYLGQVIVPSPAALDEFLSYLRVNDPIGDHEMRDILKEAY